MTIMIKIAHKFRILSNLRIFSVSLFSTATSVSWTGPPYNIAILDGQTGTISCNGSRPLHWRSLRPTDKGLGNGNTDARSGYNISESPPGIYHLQFTGNVSSSPTIISCSEPGSGIEKKVYVIVFGKSNRTYPNFELIMRLIKIT